MSFDNTRRNILKFITRVFLLVFSGLFGTSKNLIKLDTNKIIYISCNPTTQARDLNVLLERGYKLKKLAMIDMFPHTPHIESVALITKK